MNRPLKKWVVDTSVFVDLLRGTPQARDLLLSAAKVGAEVWSVTVVRTELLAGMRSKEERGTRHILDSTRWLDVTKEIADAAGHFARRYRKSHAAIDLVDFIIAGAARSSGAQLMTLNVKHFPMFKGLRPAYVK